MRAVHGSEVAAETSGVDTSRYKIQVFVLSAAMAGLAGSLYAHHAAYVHPGTFGFHASINFLVMGVLGGMASIWGAVFGAGAVSLIAENLRLFQEFSTIAFGGVLIVIMIFMPTGIWRGTGEMLRRLMGLRRKQTVGQRTADV
jgi:branched-chain amino acid transport system permease protein